MISFGEIDMGGEATIEVTRILVPVDFSEHSEEAVAHAVKLAERFQAKLFLLHVIHSIRPRHGLERNREIALKMDRALTSRSSEKLNEVARKLVPPSLDVTCDIVTGNAAEQIVEAARVQAIDLIVMATHGRTALKHLFLGSVAEGVIRHAPCSVLVVRAAAPVFERRASTLQELRMVIAAIDFSEASEDVLEIAEQWVRAMEATLVITHVAAVYYPMNEYGALEVPALDAELLDIGAQKARRLVERERMKGLEATEEVRQGDAGVQLLEAAAKYDAEIIIMGTRGLTGLKHVLLGSTAEHVIRHAHCPVLVVRKSHKSSTEQKHVPKQQETAARRPNMEILKEIVNTHPFLQGLTREELDVVLSGAVVAKFESGEVIFREGDYADKFFLIHEGEVAVECHARDHDVLVETLQSGEVLGWSWMFAPFSWHFQARAVERTVALQLNGAHLLIASEQDDRFGHKLMKRIAQILIHRLQMTRKRLIEQCESIGSNLGDIL
jgi:CRP/FNR family cyclic AMP-dependent transcriptional regulator